MTDFKVGDKVEGITHHDGETGTIVSTPASSGGQYIYATMNDGSTGLFKPEELKLVKPEPKFAVGDWVKVHGRNDKWDGTVGTVQTASPRPYGTRAFLYTILKDGKAADDLRFFENQLEATEAPSKFKVGDRVAPTQTAVSEHKGQTGTIEAVNPKSMWPFKVRFSDGQDEIFYVDEIEFAPKFATGGWVLPAYAEADVRLTAKVFGNLSTAEVKGYSKDKPEAVKHPAHYGGGDNPYEAIKVIEAWGLGFNLGNALKYLARAGKKGNKVEDLKKLVEYVQFEIAKEEAK